MTAPADSETIRSLIHCCKKRSDLAERLSILIYDNSPYPQSLPVIDFIFGAMEYFHDARNGGLAAAYNYALATASHRNIQWLLLLDQDTRLDVDLFSDLFREICAQPLPNVSAYVPKLMQNGSVISPQIVGRFRNKSVSPQFSGLSSPITALNSATCLKVQTVIEVGGFPLEYPLDYLDHIMFHRLRAINHHIVVLDVIIPHRLSLVNMETEMSIERYVNMLAAEWKFVKETNLGGGALVHRMRLLKRAVSHFLKLQNRSYALRTLKSGLKGSGS